MFVKCNETGRSMIEMLGVLAIVGILSAGGIAGYGKAMYNYRSIKCAEEYNLFIQDLLAYEKDWLRMMRQAGEGHLFLAAFLEQAGMLPRRWKRDISGSIVIDSLGNQMLPFVRNDKGNSKFNKRVDIDLLISKDLGSGAVEFCRTMFHNVLLPNCEGIFALQVLEKKGGSWGGGNGSGIIYGCQQCSGSEKCLERLTAADIENLCRLCSDEQEACNVLILF